jgi:pimeloyl-ACP methyl ester carboxylesterase
VAVEGGPGFPSTGSRVEYTGIYGPLLRERGLLLMDQRGTGGSALIKCSLQNYKGVSSGLSFAPVVAGCAREIARRYGSPDLFATAYAMRDLAALIRALRLGRVDLYGDSYGTYFVQSFISRHQDLLHSVLLDSSYPVRGLDPWYVSSATVARYALDAVCARDPSCPGGSAVARLGALLERMRAGPLTGTVRAADGGRRRVRVTIRAIVDLVQDAGSEALVYRELDPAVRAALAGDPAPLARMVDESRRFVHGGGGDPGYYSNGLYWAVACSDYPQLFSMRSSRPVRRSELSARLAAPPPGAFDPFTAREWVTVDNYTQPYMACIDWPRPREIEPAVPATPRPLPASIPLLIVGGDLDSLTPLPDARVFGPTLGANVRIVELPNTTHVTSEGDGTLVAGASCARAVIRRFVRAPERLGSLDTSCTRFIPHVHTAGSYPARLADATPAQVVSGPDPGLDRRRAATVAAGALADAPVRYWFSGAARGAGLRGGSFTAKGYPFVRLTLKAVRFAGDATVSGKGSWRFSDGATRGTLKVRLPGGATTRVRVVWTQRTDFASARIGRATLRLPAP